MATEQLNPLLSDIKFGGYLEKQSLYIKNLEKDGLC